jgi:ketol-acid reductoisomerase
MIGPVGKIYYDDDASIADLEGQTLAVIGYGNQGRSWALNLRDSGLSPMVCVRQDETRERAESDGFATLDLTEANQADVLCILLPDDVIPTLGLQPRDDSCVIVASGYTLAFDRISPPGDTGLVAPRMLGPEVRLCYEEGIGFITAVGVHKDATGRALKRVLAVAKAIGGLRQGGIEMSAKQETILDLGVEQVLSPAMGAVNQAFTRIMLENEVPPEAIVTELILSGEFERTYRLVREVGYAAQFRFHSPTSQYGQLTRRDRFAYLDPELMTTMRELAEDITSGRFADEWDAERESGYPVLEKLRETFAGTAVRDAETELRKRLGSGALAREAEV